MYLNINKINGLDIDRTYWIEQQIKLVKRWTTNFKIYVQIGY